MHYSLPACAAVVDCQFAIVVDCHCQFASCEMPVNCGDSSAAHRGQSSAAHSGDRSPTAQGADGCCVSWSWARMGQCSASRAPTTLLLQKELYVGTKPSDRGPAGLLATGLPAGTAFIREQTNNILNIVAWTVNFEECSV